jgi:hypothetical protein
MPDMQWLRGAERDPIHCGPGGVWERLAMDGWQRVGVKDGCGCLVEDQFSHWMPLPEPPQVSA